MSAASEGNSGSLGGSRKSGYPKAFEKWGIDVVRAGYTLIPNHLMNINMYLSNKSKLSTSEMMVLLIVISNWWNPRKFPAASKKYIGERCNLSERQVQRVIKSLERKGAVRRYSDYNNEVGGANKFDLRGILDILKIITKSHLDHDSIDKYPRAGKEVQLELNFSGEERLPVGESEFETDDEIPL